MAEIKCNSTAFSRVALLSDAHLTHKRASLPQDCPSIRINLASVFFVMNTLAGASATHHYRWKTWCSSVHSSFAWVILLAIITFSLNSTACSLRPICFSWVIATSFSVLMLFRLLHALILPASWWILSGKERTLFALPKFQYNIPRTCLTVPHQIIRSRYTSNIYRLQRSRTSLLQVLVSLNSFLKNLPSIPWVCPSSFSGVAWKEHQ